MRLSLRPDRVFERYTDVTPQMLTERGITLLFCDLDYTLAPKSVKTADETVCSWLASVEASGITVIILSNNRHPKRVRKFCADLGIGYIGHANKPFFDARRWCRLERRSRAVFTTLRPEAFRAENAAYLGDKLLTDMLCANLNDGWALMVEPLGGPVGVWNHVLHLLQQPFKALAREKR